MQTAKKIGVIGLAVIGIFFLILLLLFQYASVFAPLDPSYRAAKDACDRVKIGDTYDVVKVKVGNFFPADPEPFVDKDGNGQVWLINNVKSVQVACDVEFRNGRVTFASMMNEGAF